MQTYVITAVTAATNYPLPGASVTVYLTGTTTLASLYNTSGVPIANPMTADGNGIAAFEVADGTYDIVAQSGSYVGPTRVKVQIYDLAVLASEIQALQGAVNPAHFGAIGDEVTLLGALTSGQPTVGVSHSGSVVAGMRAWGVGVPTGATVVTVAATVITLSANATSTSSQYITFATQDDTTYLQNCLNAAARWLSPTYVDAELQIDFGGKSYAITGPLNATSHPWTRLKNGKLVAVGSGWASGSFMFNAVGANQYANIGFSCTLAFECNRLTSGIALANAYRFRVEPTISHPLGTGVYVGSNVGLAFIGGIINEVEDDDPDFTTYTRVATMVYLDSGAGDIWVDVKAGWAYRCIYNGASGIVHLAGHWYCSSTSTAIYGIAYEQVDGGNALIHDAYIDTGDFIYRGGLLQISSTVRFFHLSAVTPSALSDHYIQAIASSAGQYFLLTHDANVMRYDRTVPLVKSVATGGNSWINLYGPILTGNQAVQSVADPFTVNQTSAITTVMRIQSPVSGGGYINMADKDTANSPAIGAVVDNLVLYQLASPRWSVYGSGSAFLPWADNAYSLGTAGNRPTQIFAAAGSINTSDETEKEQIATISDAALDAWGDVSWSEYKFKGGARTHAGLVSQRVAAAFKAHGLDPFAYGVVCRDDLPAEPALYEPVVDASGKPTLDKQGQPELREIRPAREAGERWGIRYDEAQALEAAWQRREIARLKAKIGA